MSAESDNIFVLAVETSGRYGSVACGQGDKILAETRFSGLLRHNAEIFVNIRDLLARFGKKPSDIGHIYITNGPGSFTGLRIAITFAKMAALAISTKIVTVNTMDAIVANTYEYDTYGDNPPKIAAILDAKRQQFFTAVYEKSGQCWIKTVPDYMANASQFIEKFGAGPEPLWLLGEGLLYYRDSFISPGVRFFPEELWYPKASKVYFLGRRKARLCEFTDPARLMPFYLRQPDAIVKKRPDQC